MKRIEKELKKQSADIPPYRCTFVAVPKKVEFEAIQFGTEIVSAVADNNKIIIDYQ